MPWDLQNHGRLPPVHHWNFLLINNWTAFLESLLPWWGDVLPLELPMKWRNKMVCCLHLYKLELILVLAQQALYPKEQVTTVPLCENPHQNFFHYIFQFIGVWNFCSMIVELNYRIRTVLWKKLCRICVLCWIMDQKIVLF